jgi:hypothetical protein
MLKAIAPTLPQSRRAADKLMEATSPNDDKQLAKVLELVSGFKDLKIAEKRLQRP